MPLRARGAVGDVAHRVDRLMCRAGCDDRLVCRLSGLARCRAVPPPRRRFQRFGHPAVPASPPSAISPRIGPMKWTPSTMSFATLRLTSPDSTTSSGSWPAPSAPAARWRAGWSRRDRWRGRWPSSPSGRRWRARPARGRNRAPAGYGRHPASSSREKRSVWTLSAASAPTASGVTNSCAAGHDRDGCAALAQPADQVEALIGRDAARDDQENRLPLRTMAFYPLPFAPPSTLSLWRITCNRTRFEVARPKQDRWA